MLIGVIGLNSSGKDEVADHISKNYGFRKCSLSDIVREETTKQGLDPASRDNLNKVAEDLRKIKGPDFLAKRSIKNYSKEQKLVLSSFRHPTEIDRVKEKGGIIIQVKVDINTRYARSKLRERDIGDTFEQFKSKEERELVHPDKDRMQIAQVLEKTDYLIDNNASLEELYEKVDELMQKLTN